MTTTRKTALPLKINNIGFNYQAQSQFINEHGYLIEHYAATPSPIGLVSRGDYRRPDKLDDDSVNGFIYNKVGEFNGLIVGNNAQIQMSEAMLDTSLARLILPMHYVDGTTEIQLLPGYRIYIKTAKVIVPNYQRVEHNPTHVDILQFPAESVDNLIDSNGVKYTYNTDFGINTDGNIYWISGGKKPGYHPDSGKGLVYSIRYNYKAFWYVHQLLNEIRMSNDIGGTPKRLPYHATLQREYVYHNSNKTSETTPDNNKTIKTSPIEGIKEKYKIKIDTNQYE